MSSTHFFALEKKRVECCSFYSRMDTANRASIKSTYSLESSLRKCEKITHAHTQNKRTM